jgi:vacuolar-type H+-ATPase subunit H
MLGKCADIVEKAKKELNKKLIEAQNSTLTIINENEKTLSKLFEKMNNENERNVRVELNDLQSKMMNETKVNFLEISSMKTTIIILSLLQVVSFIAIVCAFLYFKYKFNYKKYGSKSTLIRLNVADDYH